MFDKLLSFGNNEGIRYGNAKIRICSVKKSLYANFYLDDNINYTAFSSDEVKQIRDLLIELYPVEHTNEVKQEPVTVNGKTVGKLYRDFVVTVKILHIHGDVAFVKDISDGSVYTIDVSDLKEVPFEEGDLVKCKATGDKEYAIKFIDGEKAWIVNTVDGLDFLVKTEQFIRV